MGGILAATSTHVAYNSLGITAAPAAPAAASSISSRRQQIFSTAHLNSINFESIHPQYSLPAAVYNSNNNSSSSERRCMRLYTQEERMCFLFSLPAMYVFNMGRARDFKSTNHIPKRDLVYICMYGLFLCTGCMYYIVRGVTDQRRPVPSPKNNLQR